MLLICGQCNNEDHVPHTVTIIIVSSLSLKSHLVGVLIHTNSMVVRLQEEPDTSPKTWYDHT